MRVAVAAKGRHRRLGKVAAYCSAVRCCRPTFPASKC
jgi:hypothetical protein